MTARALRFLAPIQWLSGACFAAACTTGLFAIWMTIEREHGYDVVFRSYVELASVKDRPFIQNVTRPDLSKLSIDIGMDLNDPDSQAQNIVFETNSGIERHFMQIDKKYPPFELTTVVATSDESPVVSFPTLPFDSGVRYRLDDFVNDKSMLSPDSVRFALTWLEDRGLLDPDIGQDTRLLSIAQALRSDLLPHRGVPNPAMRHMDGVEQYLAAMEGRSEIYCANHAEIMAFFANVAGIPTRIVDVGGAYDDVLLGAHAFNESFLEEFGQWAYVDLQLDIGLVKNELGAPLNGMDLLWRTSSQSFSGLTAHRLTTASIEEVAYPVVATQVGNFIPPDATLTYLWSVRNRYSFHNRLLRLFVRPQPAYSLLLSGPGAGIRLFLTYASIGFISIAILGWIWGSASRKS